MSKVAVISCHGYEPGEVLSAVGSALAHLGGLERFVKPGMRVLLKPNLLLAKRPEVAATTHPAVVQAVATLVRQAGGTVTIADSPGGPYMASSLRSVYRATGMEQVAQDTGATLNYDLADVEVACPSARLLKRIPILKPIVEADLVINLPKLKAHSQMIYTGAVKNMFGAIPGTAKIEYHMRLAESDRFADAIIDIFLATRPALTIMDAVVGMDGAGPSAGDPRQIGVILAGEDAFALDFAALQVVGANPADVPVMKAAMRRDLAPCRVPCPSPRGHESTAIREGAGESSKTCPRGLGHGTQPTTSDIEVVGRAIQDVRVKQFNMPGTDAMLAVTWSHSKLLQKFASRVKPRPVFIHDICTGCGICGKSCPAQVITMCGGKPRADLEKCIRCFCCQELCPSKAVKIKRLPQALSSVLRIVFFFASMLSARLHPKP
jgi:uncharacterized protein (DUF362 family)/Pyruvate/2-oxoacid:ferredoxin oxidoreductase delta subunit